MFRIISPLALWLMMTGSVFAHELWVEPETFEADKGASVNAALVNGQDFAGNSLVYATRSIVRLEKHDANGRTPIEGTLGDRPAIRLNALPEGLVILGYESRPSRIDYRTWSKFEAFAIEKGLEKAASVHRSYGIPFEDFAEGYTRFSKSLIAVGNGKGNDLEFGFEVEFVALENPYSNTFDGGIDVIMMYQNDPLPNQQVTVFERNKDGEVNSFTSQTDINGIVSVPVIMGHDYMLDAVIFRKPSAKLLERMDVDWETLWANLTFSVPERN